MTLPGCKNGYCEFPLQCICEDGWSGLFCHKRKSQLVFSVAMQARKLLIQNSNSVHFYCHTKFTNEK